MNEKKFCRRCHKRRVITNKHLGWCRLCSSKVNEEFSYIKVLPHPEHYDVILDLYSQGWPQIEIAKKFKRSRTGVQGIISRYTQKVNVEGEVRPR